MFHQSCPNNNHSYFNFENFDPLKMLTTAYCFYRYNQQNSFIFIALFTILYEIVVLSLKYVVCLFTSLYFCLILLYIFASNHGDWFVSKLIRLNKF